MRNYPVSIVRVEKILTTNSRITAEVIDLAPHFDDESLQQILGRLSVISTRMSLLVSCHDIPELRCIDEMIDPAVEERFFKASEEFLYQIDHFILRVKGNRHAQA
ncbi:hypothetical protein [Pseudomonas sp. S1(2024)]|uniref:hypothetical protein n=1 Tax=Pseudomonas sp. S1(2024) TaxID=3390191 RepID=UPI00397A20B8